MSNIIIGKGICINNKSINTKVKIDNEQLEELRLKAIIWRLESCLNHFSIMNHQ